MSTSMSAFFSRFPNELEKAKIGLILSALNWGIGVPLAKATAFPNDELGVTLIVGIVISVLCALFAITKRRNPLHWALWGLNFHFIAFAVLLFKSKLPKVPEKLQGENDGV